MRAVIDRPTSPFAEAFRSLRTAIQFSGRDKAQIVAITSALPGEGKTTVATCLALSAACAGEQVVLIDTDLRRRGVSRFLGTGGDRPGLTQVLDGSAGLDQALVHDPESGAYFLPIVPKEKERTELLTGEAMDKLLQALRARFTYIVIDTAPLLPIAAARVLVAKADAVALVVHWRSTPDHAVRAALRLLPARRTALAGIVLSRVNMKKQARYGYGDESFYYPKYQSYFN